MKIIAIGGEPGAGKTSLMKKIIEKYKMLPAYEAFKLVPYLNKNNYYVLGKYEQDEVFAGTDRMSMAVQPEAKKFLSSLPENSIVLFEGDRLFNSSFLEMCVELYDTKIIYLKTSKNVRQGRYEERKSNQNETWLQGRETKISNILSNIQLMFNIESYENNNLEQQSKLVNIISGYME